MHWCLKDSLANFLLNLKWQHLKIYMLRLPWHQDHTSRWDEITSRKVVIYRILGQSLEDKTNHGFCRQRHETRPHRLSDENISVKFYLVSQWKWKCFWKRSLSGANFIPTNAGEMNNFFFLFLHFGCLGGLLILFNTFFPWDFFIISGLVFALIGHLEFLRLGISRKG